MNLRLLRALVIACLSATAWEIKADDSQQIVNSPTTAAAQPASGATPAAENEKPEPEVVAIRSKRSALAPGVECRIQTRRESAINVSYDGVVKAVDEDSVRLIAKRSKVCKSYDVPQILVGIPTMLRVGWCAGWKPMKDEEIVIANDKILHVWLLKKDDSAATK